jgi:hypothetical protein
MLSTDGCSNSFSDENAFLKVATDLESMVRTSGWPELETQLPIWLEEITRTGSGDDITIVIGGPVEADGITAKSVLETKPASVALENQPSPSELEPLEAPHELVESESKTMDA